MSYEKKQGMTSHWKKDHQHLWNTDKPIAIPRHDDEDDQDIYISERSSIASSDDLSITVHATGKRLPTPSPPMVSLQKGSQLPRYARRGSPESGPVPMTYIQFERQDEKIMKKPRRKPPAPAPGTLTTVFETKTSESGSHHPVYGVYHKVKVPDRMGRHRGLPDGQANSHDSFDTPQQAAQASLTTSTIKPTPAPRPSRREGVPMNLSHHLIHHDNDHSPQKTSPRQSNGGKEPENDERRDHSNRRAMPQQRHKPKINHDWADPQVQSFSNKSPQEAETLIITSNSINTRSNNRPKIIEKNSMRHETDDSPSKHRHYPNHSPSIPSQPNHHHHHHHYAHIRRRPPSGVHMTAELPSVDVSSKKFERSSQFQHTRDLFRVSPSPPTPIYNPASTSYLPPITRDHHTKANIARFPNEYYGTLARQAHVKDWEESIEIPKIYKGDPHGRFYDRYAHTMPDKRLVA